MISDGSIPIMDNTQAHGIVCSNMNHHGKEMVVRGEAGRLMTEIDLLEEWISSRIGKGHFPRKFGGNWHLNLPPRPQGRDMGSADGMFCYLSGDYQCVPSSCPHSIPNRRTNGVHFFGTPHHNGYKPSSTANRSLPTRSICW